MTQKQEGTFVPLGIGNRHWNWNWNWKYYISFIIAPRATELGTIVPKGEGTHPSRCVKSLQVSPGHVTSEKSYTCSSKTAMTIKRGRAVTYGPETQPPSHVTFSNVVM